MSGTIAEGQERNAEHHSWQALAAFGRRQFGPLAVGAAIVLLALAGAGLVLAQQRRQAERASQNLLAAQTPKQWESLLEQYPRSPTAPIARLALATSHYNEGAYDQALAAYGLFLDRYPKHVMAPAAELGKVQCLEARGEIEAALNGYSLFAIARPTHELLPQALFGKARCLQLLQRFAEARAIYEDYIAAHPEGDWTAQAEFSLRALERQIRARQAAPAPTPAPAPDQAAPATPAPEVKAP